MGVSLLIISFCSKTHVPPLSGLSYGTYLCHCASARHRDIYIWVYSNREGSLPHRVLNYLHDPLCTRVRVPSALSKSSLGRLRAIEIEHPGTEYTGSSTTSGDYDVHSTDPDGGCA